MLPAGSQTFGSPVDVGASAPGRLAFDPCEFGAGSTSSGTDPVTVTTFTTSSGGINTGSKMATSVPFSTGGFSPEITAFPPIPGGSSNTGDLEIIFSVTASNGCTTTYQTHAAFDPNTCQLTYSAVAPTIVSGPVCPPKGSYLAEIDNSGFGSCSAGGNPGICVESALTDFSSSGTPPVSDTGMELFYYRTPGPGQSTPNVTAPVQSNPLANFTDTGPFTNSNGVLERDFNGLTGGSPHSQKSSSLITRSDGSIVIIALDRAVDSNGNAAPNLHLLQGFIDQSAPFSDMIIVPGVQGSSSNTYVDLATCAGGDDFIGCFLNDPTVVSSGSQTNNYETLRCTTGSAAISDRSAGDKESRKR